LPVFPLAISSNLFSVTALLIFFGVTGNSALAADIAVIQGAALTVFLAFSGNSRNLLLSESVQISFGQLARFRSVFVLPFALVVYYLCKTIGAVSDFLIFVLILRRCSEWLAELVLSDREYAEDSAFAGRYVLLQSLSFSSLLLYGVVDEDVYAAFFVFWAITPVLLGVGYFFKALKVQGNDKRLPVLGYVLHLGSSWVIAASTFVFRIMILALTNKVTGGELFTAFAMGGMLNSIYTYVVGPSLISKETETIKKVFRLISFSCVGIGIVIALLSEVISTTFGSSVLFFQALGFSVVGSAIMMVSQRQRMILLQIKQGSVFVPDVLANILIVAIVPIVFFTVGKTALGALFLCNAFLTYIFYALPIDISKEV